MTWFEMPYKKEKVMTLKYLDKMSLDVLEMSYECLVVIDSHCADVCFVSTVGGSIIFSVGVVMTVVIIPFTTSAINGKNCSSIVLFASPIIWFPTSPVEPLNSRIVVHVQPSTLKMNYF